MSERPLGQPLLQPLQLAFVRFLAALDLHCYLGSSLVSGTRGYSRVVVWGLLIAVASRCGAWASVVVEHGLSCYAAAGIFPDQGSNPCLLR